MKEFLELWKNKSGHYQGKGINHEGQPFTGKLTLMPLLGGRGFSIKFSATGTSGTLYHQEESTVAPSISGELTLWNLNTNMPGLLAHELRTAQPRGDASHSYVFGFNERSNMQAFREEIAIDLWPNGDLSYTYSWGMPGGEFKERSSARMSRSSEKMKCLKVAPTLLLEKIEPTMNFFLERLGFTKAMDVPGNNGLVFAMMISGNAEIHLQTRASAAEDMPYFANVAMPSSSFLYIDVEDVNSLYEKMKDTDIVLPLEKTFYGATHFFLREPGGHVLGFSQNE